MAVVLPARLLKIGSLLLRNILALKLRILISRLVLPTEMYLILSMEWVARKQIPKKIRSILLLL